MEQWIEEWIDDYVESESLDKELLLKSHKPIYSISRQCFWKILHENEGYNFPRIAKEFGRHHSTIIQGLDRLKNLIQVRDFDVLQIYKKIYEIYDTENRV